MLLTALLCTAAFVAGFVDAVAGGGGLIQLPALLILLPGVPIPTLLGTGKLAGFAGTASAAADYMRQRIEIRWRVMLPAACASGIASWIGAHAVSDLRPEAIRPMVIVLLIAVAAYTLWRKDFGALRHAPRPARTEQLLALGGGAAIGFYDGFFGPGAGSFYLVFLVGVLGYDFLMASVAAKIINMGSNITTLGYFGATGQVLWSVGLPMAVANILGAQVGTRMAVRRGVGFVRPLFLTMVGAAIVRLLWDLLRTPA